ncbi:MAG: U32 family peptidase [Spirochaetales bacterium]|nr:U32 family peptidase [Spirochaetales bacterium]
MESFYIAIEAGADAVYLGLDKFNARLRARNFTPPLLQAAIQWAHKKNKKVYITLNTLIKEREIKDAVHILAVSESLGADALIITDPGLIALARKHFPALCLHASTQMGIHNTAGVETAKKLGIQRVILARELTIEEIKSIRNKTRTGAAAMELEVFVHGALCYSLSGYCLASSFLGGKSGNRGLCTQVCRRPFIRSSGKGIFFSPLDLQAIEMVPQFGEMGIDSLKIEGRMKNAGYLETVVTAYRRAIDNPSSIPDVLGELKFDFGRPKTRFFLSGQDSRILGGKTARTAGLYIGTISKKTGPVILIDNPMTIEPPVSAGDWIRILPKNGFEGERVKIISNHSMDSFLELELSAEQKAGSGDEVYLADRNRNTVLPKELSAPAAAKVTGLRNAGSILASLSAGNTTRPSNKQAKSRLLLAADSPEWFEILAKQKSNGLIVTASKSGISGVMKRLGGRATAPVYISLPLFVAEHDVQFWKHTARQLIQAGIAGFVINNPGHLALVPGNADKIAGTFFYSLNSPARSRIAAMGCRDFMYSLEDDFLNIRNTGSRPGWITLFSHIPVFISRINPGFAPGTKLSDQNKKSFFTAVRDDLYVLCGSSPLCLFSRREKLQQLGINTFIVDFSFTEPDAKYAGSILEAYHHQEKIHDSSLFNFKAELA